MELIEVGHRDPRAAAAGRNPLLVVLLRLRRFRGVQRERGAVGRELGPTRSLKPQREPDRVAIERDRAVMSPTKTMA
jgi:hypothetical protein